jgi:hypothetical protein
MASANLAVGRSVLTIVPHNTNRLAASVRAIYVGTGGSIALVAEDGTEATFVDVPQGTLLPVETRQVKATGTTASNLVGLV